MEGLSGPPQVITKARVNGISLGVQVDRRVPHAYAGQLETGPSSMYEARVTDAGSERLNKTTRCSGVLVVLAASASKKRDPCTRNRKKAGILEVAHMARDCVSSSSQCPRKGYYYRAWGRRSHATARTSHQGWKWKFSHQSEGTFRHVDS